MAISAFQEMNVPPKNPCSGPEPKTGVLFLFFTDTVDPSGDLPIKRVYKGIF
jgi:hypothetical protein